MKRIVLLFMIISTPLFSSWKNITPDEYEDFVYELCIHYRIPLDVFTAMAYVETGWRNINSGPNSDGSYDIGIFQLNSRYLDYFVDKFWGEKERFDPYNPYHNMAIAAKYLYWLRENNKNWQEAIISYNIGMYAFKNGMYIHSGRSYFFKVSRAMTKAYNMY